MFARQEVNIIDLKLDLLLGLGVPMRKNLYIHSLAVKVEHSKEIH